MGQTHFPSIIFYIRIPLSLVENTNRNILIAFEASVLSVCKFKELAETTDDYVLEPTPLWPHTPFRSSGSPDEVEGKNLQPITSTTGGKTFVHVSQSGPINYFCHSTSVFHRPHDREIYYEIVADSNKLQETVRKL